MHGYKWSKIFAAPYKRLCHLAHTVSHTIASWHVQVSFILTHSLTKASDVQHADEVGGCIKGEALVDPFDHMIKEPAVNGFGEGIAGIVGLFHLQRDPGEEQSGAVEVNIWARPSANATSSIHVYSLLLRLTLRF